MVTPATYATMTGLTQNQGTIAATIQALRPVAGTRPGADGADLFDALYQAGPAASRGIDMALTAGVRYRLP